jgi:hypothetical protein
MPRMSALLAALALLAPGCDTNTCETVASDVGELCNQGALAADRQLVIEVRELCGKGCSGQPSCDAFLRNGQVVLDVQQEVCQETTFYQCIALGCVRRVIRCTLPDLHEGDYTLVAPGTAVQLLRVRAGGQASCRFPLPGDGGV